MEYFVIKIVSTESITARNSSGPRYPITCLSFTSSPVMKSTLGMPTPPYFRALPLYLLAIFPCLSTSIRRGTKEEAFRITSGWLKVESSILRHGGHHSAIKSIISGLYSSWASASAALGSCNHWIFGPASPCFFGSFFPHPLIANNNEIR